MPAGAEAVGDGRVLHLQEEDPGQYAGDVVARARAARVPAAAVVYICGPCPDIRRQLVVRVVQRANERGGKVLEARVPLRVRAQRLAGARGAGEGRGDPGRLGAVGVRIGAQAPRTSGPERRPP